MDKNNLKIKIKELEEENKRLIQLDKERTSLFAQIANEIIDPTNILQGYFEDLLNQNNNENENISKAIKTVDKLRTMVDNLFQLINLEISNTSYNIEKTQIENIINEIYIKFESIADNLGIELKKECFEEICEKYIYCDRSKIFTVFSILLKSMIDKSNGNITFGCEEYNETHAVFFIKGSYPNDIIDNNDSYKHKIDILEGLICNEIIKNHDGSIDYGKIYKGYISFSLSNQYREINDENSLNLNKS